MPMRPVVEAQIRAKRPFDCAIAPLRAEVVLIIDTKIIVPTSLIYKNYTFE